LILDGREVVRSRVAGAISLRALGRDCKDTIAVDVMPARAIEALANFAHLLATQPSSDEVKTLLVDTAIGVAGAAVLVEVDARGALSITASRGYDARPALPHDPWSVELGPALLAVSQLASVEQLPLVADGRLFGVLVLLFDAESMIDDDALAAAGALVDVAAVALARANDGDDDEPLESHRALAQAEKLRALGGMAAGISHDLKNVFGPLLMQLDVLARKDDADVAFLKERLEKMRRPLERGLAIVERLRSFSKRSGSEEREVVDMHTVVDDAVGICRPRTVGTDVEIAVEPGDAPQVRIEVAEAVAALTNLVMNAIDAVAAHGKNGRVTVTIGAKNEGANVDVVDTGPGVPEGVGDRIFEAFFTTKGKQGTGLGLAMVRDFARRHGGTVELGRAQGGGARFSLWLPAADATIPPAA
jgi:signal transduction histidine kinase